MLCISDQVDRILHKSSLDIVVDLADIFVSVMLDLPFVIIAEIDVQAWIIIDFEDPGLEIPIDHEIESQDLKRLSSDIMLIGHRCDLLLD